MKNTLGDQTFICLVSCYVNGCFDKAVALLKATGWEGFTADGPFYMGTRVKMPKPDEESQQCTFIPSLTGETSRCVNADETLRGLNITNAAKWDAASETGISSTHYSIIITVSHESLRHATTPHVSAGSLDWIRHGWTGSKPTVAFLVTERVWNNRRRVFG